MGRGSLVRGVLLVCVLADPAGAQNAPYPVSPVVESLSVDPNRTSIGTNGDNWPITWADDGDLYTVYCDGVGFGSTRHSMGHARILGDPPNVTGRNIPSPTGEWQGDGPKGRKACGMVMVNGVLYMWVRNRFTDGTGSILAWSSDHSKTWTWAPWEFPDIGYPVWLNFGRNYAGARDTYLYFYSPNSKSAYTITDEIILGRVPKSQVTTRSTYTFFSGLDGSGNPTWTSDFARRKPVFNNPGRCYRPGVVYNPAIGRYLLAMMTKIGHLSVFDAPEPWGPWTTVYYNDGFTPNETPFAPHMPGKWISADGKTFTLIYSCYPKGPYRFNIQKCTLTLKATPVVWPTRGWQTATPAQMGIDDADSVPLDSE